MTYNFILPRAMVQISLKYIEHVKSYTGLNYTTILHPAHGTTLLNVILTSFQTLILNLALCSSERSECNQQFRTKFGHMFILAIKISYSQFRHLVCRFAWLLFAKALQNRIVARNMMSLFDFILLRFSSGNGVTKPIVSH